MSALARLTHTEFKLVIVGDGPERATLESAVRQHDLNERVRFTGFLSPAEVMKWYAESDIYILPSSETWGVSAVEAAAAGLTIVLSDQVGCAPDLNQIYPLKIYPYGQPDELVTVLEQMLTRPVSHATTSCTRLEKAWSYQAQAASLQSFLITHQ